MTLAEMVTAVRVEGGVDTTTGATSEATVKQKINQRYRRMVTKARWRRGIVSVGATKVGVAEYAIPYAVAELEGLMVDGGPVARIGQTELWRLKAGQASASGSVFAPDFTWAGIEQVEIYPAPVQAGLAIEALATLHPDELVNDPDKPIVPEQFHPAIVDGAVGDFRALLDERLDQVPYFDQRFDAAVEELRRLKNSQTGGGNVAQIRVGGFHL